MSSPTANPFEAIRADVQAAAKALREEGKGKALAVAGGAVNNRLFRWSWRIRYAWHKAARPLEGFTFAGERYHYFVAPYNSTFETERCVEVALAWRAYERHKGARILEIGNVLSHYFEVDHTIVDKYEAAQGVLNKDVLELPGTMGPFDFILAISTLEHVGWDEAVHDPELSLKAIDVLYGMLAPGGELMFTVPIGYNPAIDRWLRDPTHKEADIHIMRRLTTGPKWRECAFEEAASIPKEQFGWHMAAIAVVQIRKPTA